MDPKANTHSSVRPKAWTDPDDKLIDDDKRRKLAGISGAILQGGSGTKKVIPKTNGEDDKEGGSDSDGESWDTGFKMLPVKRIYSKFLNTILTAVDFEPIQEYAMYATGDTVQLQRVGATNDKFYKIMHNITFRHAVFVRTGEIWIATTDPGFISVRIKDETISNIRPRSSDKPILKFAKSEAGDFIAALLTNNTVVAFNIFTKEQEELPLVQDAQSMCFSEDGSMLFIITRSGKFYEICMTTKTTRCCEDQGGIEATAIAVSKEHIACGSKFGIVNLYKREWNDGGRPTLVKEFKSFEKVVHHMKFNHDGSILAYASRIPHHCYVMVHIPTLRSISMLYAKDRRPQICSDLAFSPHGKYLSMAGAGGAVISQIGQYKY